MTGLCKAHNWWDPVHESPCPRCAQPAMNDDLTTVYADMVSAHAEMKRRAECFDVLLAALTELVARCDGDEGVRADGSNIQTMRAHAAIARAESKSAQNLVDRLRDTEQRWINLIAAQGWGDQLDGDIDNLREAIAAIEANDEGRA